MCWWWSKTAEFDACSVALSGIASKHISVCSSITAFFCGVCSSLSFLILPLFSTANTVWWELRWLGEVHWMGVIGWVLGIGSHRGGSMSRGQLVTGEVPNIPGTHLPFITVQLLLVSTKSLYLRRDNKIWWVPHMNTSIQWKFLASPC